MAGRLVSGLFVAVEGIDHSGKTTLVRGLRDHFIHPGLLVATTREPSTGPVGSLLRQLSAAGPVPATALALLSAADRHHQQPALQTLLGTHQLVVADRYYLSGLAYHLADGIDPTFYAQCNDGVRHPDLYLILDVTPTVAARRVDRPADSRWEQPDFTRRLPAAYTQCLPLVALGHGCAVVHLDAHQPASAVLVAAIAVITDRLGTSSTRSAA